MYVSMYLRKAQQQGAPFCWVRCSWGLSFGLVWRCLRGCLPNGGMFCSAMDAGKPKGSNKMPTPSTTAGRSLLMQTLLSLLILSGRHQYDAHVSSLRYWRPMPQLTAGTNATGSYLLTAGLAHPIGASRLGHAASSQQGLWAHNASGSLRMQLGRTATAQRAAPGLASRTSSPLQRSRNRPCRLSGIDELPVPPLWGVTATHLSCRLKLPTLATTMFRQRQCLDTLSVRAARETGLTSDTDPSAFAHPNRWASWCHGDTCSCCSSLCLHPSPAHRTWTPWTEALPGPLWHPLPAGTGLEDPCAWPSFGMLLIKVLHQCTLPSSVLQLDFSEWSFLLNDAVTHWQVLGNRLTTVAALSLGLAHCLHTCICRSASLARGRLASTPALPHSSSFLRLFAAPRLEGPSPGAWPLPAIQHLRGLGFSLQAGPSPAPARCRHGPVRASCPSDACLPPFAYSGTLCMSSAGCLS